jgi:hypothetical protein
VSKLPTPTSFQSSTSSTNSSLEVLTTTIEESVRRLPPNDGLVALLYPRAASNMVMDLVAKPRPDGESIRAAAERECGRLVWDEDSLHYYLVHPALQTPFVVNITSSPAFSRVEYTLEHQEMPKNLVRLVREGNGTGSLEVDTGVAAKIDSFYIVDVAICAIMLVAVTEEKTQSSDRFEAPPSAMDKELGVTRLGWQEMELDTEVDLESQDSIKREKAKKDKSKKEKEGMGRGTRGCLKLILWGIKAVAWMIIGCLNLVAKCIFGIFKCLIPK